MARFCDSLYPEGWVSFAGNVELTKTQIDYIGDIFVEAVTENIYVEDVDYDAPAVEVKLEEGDTVVYFNTDINLCEYSDYEPAEAGGYFDTSFGNWLPNEDSGEYPDSQDVPCSKVEADFMNSLKYAIEKNILPQVEIVDVEISVGDIEWEYYGD